MSIAASSSPSSSLRPRVVLALVRRDFRQARSYRLALVLDLLFGVANLLVFFYISRTFTNGAAIDLGGAPSYFAFASVGIVITLVIGAASTGLAARIREEQLLGTLEALVVQPVSVPELSVGLAAYTFLFAMGRGAFYLLVAGLWLGADFGETSWTGLVVILLAATAAFSSLGGLLGAVVVVVKRGDALVGMVTYTMGILSGAFFPISVLPDWLEPIGAVLPTRFAFDGLRSAIFEGSGWAGDALVLLVFSVVTVPIAVWFFGRALALARRAGTLTQY